MIRFILETVIYTLIMLLGISMVMFDMGYEFQIESPYFAVLSLLCFIISCLVLFIVNNSGKIYKTEKQVVGEDSKKIVSIDTYLKRIF